VSYHHFFARNLTSRLHFALLSWLAYVRLGRAERTRTSLRQQLRAWKAELVFGLRYLRGNPF
jgi:hypothetical protein